MPRKDPPKEHRFTSTNRPTKEQIAKAAESRKANSTIKKAILKYKKMPLSKINKHLENLELRPSLYSMIEVIALNAVKKMIDEYKYYSDERDRVEGKAPLTVIHEGQMEIDAFFDTHRLLEEKNEGRDSRAENAKVAERSGGVRPGKTESKEDIPGAGNAHAGDSDKGHGGSS